MKRNHLDFDEFLKDSLKNPKIKIEYDKLQPEFALIDALIKTRAKNNLTQRQLANKMGTKQSVISRLEIGRANPTFSFLKRLAKALNSTLEIRFN
ncbi:helix-turn-helix transcriptional regulator [Candidatus Roizmanbacteria bacterium]|nr:helix-turn-helix transcriptional regulator [Candidatus Roizmanbacteria bacterium]